MKMSKGESTYAGHNRELTVTDCFSMNYSEFHFRIKSSLKLSKFIFIVLLLKRKAYLVNLYSCLWKNMSLDSFSSSE